MEALWNLFGNISFMSGIFGVTGMIPAGVAAGLGMNIWAGLSVALTLICAAVVFIWVNNRYAYMGLARRILFAGVAAMFSWISVAVIVVRNYFGWEPAVPLLSDSGWGLWGLPTVEESADVRKLKTETLGPIPGSDQEEVVDVRGSLLKMAVAAIPDEAARTQMMTALASGLSVTQGFQRLLQLGLVPLLPKSLQRQMRGLGLLESEAQPIPLPQSEEAPPLK